MRGLYLFSAVFIGIRGGGSLCSKSSPHIDPPMVFGPITMAFPGRLYPFPYRSEALQAFLHSAHRTRQTDIGLLDDDPVFNES